MRETPGARNSNHRRSVLPIRGRVIASITAWCSVRIAACTCFLSPDQGGGGSANIYRALCRSLCYENFGRPLGTWSGNRTGPVLARRVTHFEIRQTLRCNDEARSLRSMLPQPEDEAITGPPAPFELPYTTIDACIGPRMPASPRGSAIDDRESLACIERWRLRGWEITAITVRAELVVFGRVYSGQRAIGGRAWSATGRDMVRLIGDVFSNRVAALAWHPMGGRRRGCNGRIQFDFHRAYGAELCRRLHCARDSDALASSDAARRVRWRRFLSLNGARTYGSEHDQTDVERVQKALFSTTTANRITFHLAGHVNHGTLRPVAGSASPLLPPIARPPRSTASRATERRPPANAMCPKPRFTATSGFSIRCCSEDLERRPLCAVPRQAQMRTAQFNRLDRRPAIEVLPLKSRSVATGAADCS